MDRSTIRQVTGTLLALGLLLVCAPAGLASPKSDPEYAQGVELYKKRDYAAASDIFWKAITDGDTSASVWLYLAHSKAGEGKLDDARKSYKTVVDVFKDSPEAKVAATYIKALDAKTWHPGPAPGAAGAKPAPAAVGAAPPALGGLKYRITIIPPRDLHIAVSAQTIAMVKQTIDRLPKSILKVLDDGGVKVFIGPNILDKWPNSINDIKPGQDNITLPEESGRTYGRDIYLYERPVAARGSRDLGDVRPLVELQANFLHEIGHALDDCLGLYSRDANFQAEYRVDASSVGGENKAALSNYFLEGDFGAAEVCAESAGILLGGKHKDNDLFTRNFRRSEEWVKAKLKL